jgi:hypothetical protein
MFSGSIARTTVYTAEIGPGTRPMSSPRPGLLVAFALGLVVSAAIGVLPTAGASDASGPLEQTDTDPDTVLLDVALRGDGDAVWTVSSRVRLDDENTTAASESVAADVETDPDAYAAGFERRMRRTVRTAANATGREMGLRNFTVTTRNESLAQPTGVDVYRFEWTG